jgi:hypothetical protein
MGIQHHTYNTIQYIYVHTTLYVSPPQVSGTAGVLRLSIICIYTLQNGSAGVTTVGLWGKGEGGFEGEEEASRGKGRRRGKERGSEGGSDTVTWSHGQVEGQGHRQGMKQTKFSGEEEIKFEE